MGVYVIVHGGGDPLREAICSLTMRVVMSPSKIKGLCSYLRECPGWEHYLRILRVEEKIVDGEVTEKTSYPLTLDDYQGEEEEKEDEFKEGYELGRTLLGKESPSPFPARPTGSLRSPKRPARKSGRAFHPHPRGTG